jgi:DNA polymerase/3'-5' exonuclease PolX
MLTFKEYFLREGGNVFSSTGRITREDVASTVQKLEEITGLPLKDNMLGSTGKAADSGDIDLVVDSKTTNKAELESKLQAYWKQHSIDTVGTKKSGISVHFLSPIWNKQGKITNKHVQVDFMFSDDPDYLKWFYASNETAPFKGKDRNILLSAVAKNKGYSLSINGLINRDTKQVITKDPDTIAKTIFNKKATANDLNNVQAIVRKLIWIYGTKKAKEIIQDAEVTTGHTFI